MIPQPAKQQICDALYSAFSDVRSPKSIPSCDCCHTDEEKRLLLAYEPRNVPPELIREEQFSWLNTFGDENVVRYFAPCILATYLNDEDYFESDYLYELMERAGLPSWTNQQQQAVKRALIALYKMGDDPTPTALQNL